MSEWMLLLLNLSLAASVVVAAVLLARLLLRRAPRKYSYVLWSAVFFRAVCPISFSSPLSLFQLLGIRKTDGNQLGVSLAPHQTARLSWILGMAEGQKDAAGTIGAAAEQVAVESMAGFGENAAGAGITVMRLCGFLWLAGAVLFLVYSFLSWRKLRKCVAFAVRTEDGLYESDQISTAFVLGIWRPRIYLPTGLSDRELALVKEHEQVHIRRRDPLFKMLAWLITVIHWFNPLMWLAFVLMSRDMEMSCDEKVLQNLGESEKKEYSSFLLALAAPAGFPSGSPLAFGEGAVKSRIKNILRYRKGSKFMGIAAILLVAVVLTACLTNPKGDKTVEIVGDGEQFVIGGADGPTSVFLAGKLSGDASEEELEEAFGDSYTKMVFLEAWAQAVAERNADTVYEFLSPELQSKAQELGIEMAENGVRVMGWSSPFVPAGMSPMVWLSDGDTTQAVIAYPGMTSDPSWWVWKDFLTLEPEGDSYRVTQWEQKTYFEIASAADFSEAYEGWFPDYQSKAEGEKSFAEYLQEHADAGSNPAYYGKYLTPKTAAEETLHLSGGEASIVREEKGRAVVRYEWSDGAAEIDMVQPVKTGVNGIWVPDGFSVTVQE